MDRRRRAVKVVGRDPELEVFAQAVESAAAGEPSVLLVAGDPGMGKSTLLAEATSRAAIRSYVGRCVHVGGEAIALAPLVDLLRQVRRRPATGSEESEAGPSGALEALEAVLRPGAEHRSVDVLAAALDLAGALGRSGPVLVGFEDLHWGDPATWDVFEYLARNLSDERVVLAGTYRPDEVRRDASLRRRVAELLRLPLVRRLELAGLDRAAVAMQAAGVLGIPPPPSLVDELVRRGQGNPFFTEELAAAQLAGEALPAVLSDLIAADVDALDEPARRVLGAMAAVGRDTDPSLLAAVVDMDEEELEEVLRAAIEARLVVVDPAAETYSARHPLIGEVVYAGLLPTERRRLHRSIADALQAEPRLALTAGDAAGELAFHLDRAGDQRAAFAALLEAADASEAIAPSTCLTQLERALALWDLHGGDLAGAERVRRLWQAADLASAVGDNDRAVELAGTAMALGSSQHGRAWEHERLGRYLWSAGRMADSVAAYEEAARLAEEEADPARAARAMAGLAQAGLMFCDLDRAEGSALAALAGADPADAATRAMALRVIGVLEGERGEVDAAVAHCREAVDLAPAPHHRALATAYLALTLFEVGRTGEAISAGLEGSTQAERAGFESSFGAYLRAVAADGMIRTGRWDEAGPVLAGAAATRPMTIAAIRTDAARTVLAARRGDLDRARELLGELRSHPADPWHGGLVAAAAAEVHLAAGEWADAAAEARAGLSPPAGGEVPFPWRLAWLLCRAEAESALDAIARKQAADPAALTAELQELIGALRLRTGAGTPVAEMHLALAEAELTRPAGGDLEAFERAAGAARDAGDVWALAWASLLGAEAAASTGAAARAADSLRTAHAVATDLGARPLLAAVEALSRRARIDIAVAAAPPLDGAGVASLGLTPREAEVLALVAAGRTNREIGAELYVSEKTASVHVSNILRKLGVSSRVEAAAIAQRLGATNRASGP